MSALRSPRRAFALRFTIAIDRGFFGGGCFTSRLIRAAIIIECFARRCARARADQRAFFMMLPVCRGTRADYSPRFRRTVFSHIRGVRVGGYGAFVRDNRSAASVTYFAVRRRCSSWRRQVTAVSHTISARSKYLSEDLFLGTITSASQARAALAIEQFRA